jgi:hypothetical protein
MLRNAFFPFGGDVFQIIFAADARNGALLPELRKDRLA